MLTAWPAVALAGPVSFGASAAAGAEVAAGAAVAAAAGTAVAAGLQAASSSIVIVSTFAQTLSFFMYIFVSSLSYTKSPKFELATSM